MTSLQCVEAFSLAQPEEEQNHEGYGPQSGQYLHSWGGAITVSQAFQGAEAKYLRIEKIAFALIVASRKLRPYFQANLILVMTDQPIRKSMNKPKVAGRMV